MSKINNNNNVTGEKSNFWKLTTNHAIVIPILQRDYAQGRETDDVRQIRDKFVKKLFETLKKNTAITLDFVYGSLEEPKNLSKNQINHTDFVPLDGQQRLTTLFLLHWFLSIWNKNEECNDCDDFKSHMIIANIDTSRFSYRTRSSSRDFCKCLILNSNIDGILTNIKKRIPNPISSAIIDEGWFHYSWIFDPTISGMLVMLDTIYKEFLRENQVNQENNAHEYYNRLTRQELVSFNLLYLNKFLQKDNDQQQVITSDDRFSDELYIKMNSRGKPLSDYETFKSRFETFLRKYTNVNSKDFSKKIDHEWADSLWSIRNKVIPNDTEQDKYIRDNTDQMMMNLINVVLANSYALRDNTQEEGLNVVFQTDAARRRKYDLHLTFYRYTELGILNEKNDEEDKYLNDNCQYGQNVKDTLTFVHDFISDPTSYEVTSEIFDGWKCIYKVLFDKIDGKQSVYGSISYYDRLYFYSFSQFSIIGKKNIHGTLFRTYLNRWMHFIVNIVESAEINDVYDMQKFLKVISGILSEFTRNNQFDIVRYLNGISSYPDWSPVPSTQVREEILKAKLISHYYRWECVINKGDSISQWPGRSGYLLYYIGLSTMSDGQLSELSAINHLQYTEIYETYCHKISMLLHVVTNSKNKSEHLFERLLLSRGNYMRYENDERYNCKIFSMMNSSFDGRSYSWRQMLQYNGIPDSDDTAAHGYDAGVNALKQVLDALDIQDAIDEQQMKSAILMLIQKPIKPIEMWRKQMLEEPRLWEMSEKHYFWLGNNRDAWIPRKKDFNCNHYEVKSYRLYLKLQNNGNYKYYPHEWGFIYFSFKQKGTDNIYGFWINWNQLKKSWNLKLTPMDTNLNARPFTKADLMVFRNIFNYIEVNELRNTGKSLSDDRLIEHYYSCISIDPNFEFI